MRPRAARGHPLREEGPRIYTVTELAQEIRSSLEGSFPHVVVQGEITDFRAAPSGHAYFALKDEASQIKLVLFKGRARGAASLLRNGITVQVEGSVSVYTARGDLQLIVERIAPVGYGALQARFDELKRSLEREGLFAQDRKRPLPRYPTRIGLVTSIAGAAVRDMIRVLRNRAPYVRIVVAPCRVQGEGAAEEIASAIELLNRWNRVDVLIAGRGGGSLEDLWAFNEEAVVRAIATSRIPVVSAVGHETDFTLADLAADVRAATPSHAAQAVVPELEVTRETLADLTKHARDRLRRELARERHRLAGFRTHRAFRVPHRRVDDGLQSIDRIRERAERALLEWVTGRRHRIDSCAARLRSQAPARRLLRDRERLRASRHRLAMNVSGATAVRRERLAAGLRLLGSYDYRRVLARGYALVWHEGRAALIHRGATLEVGSGIEVQFVDAAARARIETVTRAGEDTDS